MVFNTSESCRRELDALLSKHTNLVDGREYLRSTPIRIIMEHLQNNNDSSVRFNTKLLFSYVNDGHCKKLFTGIANAISGKHVKLNVTKFGKNKRWGRKRYEQKRYVYSWDIENFSCKFYTKKIDDGYLVFFMQIVDHSKAQNDKSDSDSSTDSEGCESGGCNGTTVCLNFA